MFDILLACGCLITSPYRAGGFGPEAWCRYHNVQKIEIVEEVGK